jgi:zinc protease
MRDVISKTLQSGFTEDELKKAVSSWLEQRQTFLGDDQSLAWRLTNFLSDGKDLNFYSDYENKAKVLTLDQVNGALRKYISLDKITFIYAGDFKNTGGEVKKF